MEEREGGRVRGRRVRKKKNKNEKKLPNHILNMLKKVIKNDNVLILIILV